MRLIVSPRTLVRWHADLVKKRWAYPRRIGERHLRLVLDEYVDRNNAHRPHRTLQHNPPAGRPHLPALGANIRVLRRDRLCGLIREYAQVA